MKISIVSLSYGFCLHAVLGIFLIVKIVLGVNHLGIRYRIVSVAWLDVVKDGLVVIKVIYRIIPDVPSYEVILALKLPEKLTCPFVADFLGKTHVCTELIIRKSCTVSGHVEIPY